ncbi:hypothetical protein mRhiFer1_010154 [Rhinolophus ferrumequinum]|uniref:Secreted protein n=1 Tax=Rhinolophus ferrumequinum TaxID=59479 RepID=A0A7J7XQW3_RHIFE|nr:hypothetical protein mRhiFer1_010154 [Rhinolophus ferrumequinum]
MLKCAVSFCNLKVCSYFSLLLWSHVYSLCTCNMQNMKRPLASRSLHSHGAADASKLLLVHLEHCLAINYTIFGRNRWPTVQKQRAMLNFRALILSLHCISSAVHKLLFPGAVQAMLINVNQKRNHSA